MKPLDLRHIDLNLLTVFEVLMDERHVTRAAERLSRTQSAVSHALNRLREQLGDPLLIKTAQGMQPSPFALQLIEEVRPLLRTAERILQPPEPFEPARSRREFRLALTDVMLQVFIELHADVCRDAPGVTLRWENPSAALLAQIMEGQIDLALVPASLKQPEGMASLAVGSVPWGCFGRAGHPAFAQWSRKAWSAWPHVQVGVGGRMVNPVTEAAHNAGLTRHVGVQVPHFGAVGPLLATSDLLATLPVLALRTAMDTLGLAMQPPPFTIAPVEHVLVWNERFTRDTASQWLRDRLARRIIQAFI